MNHDYTHCLDFTEKCPKKCFRAQLERDLRKNAKDYAGMCFSYSHLKGSRDCCMNGNSGIKVFVDRKNYVIDIDVDEDLWKNKNKDELVKLIGHEIARALKGR